MPRVLAEAFTLESQRQPRPVWSTSLKYVLQDAGVFPWRKRST